MWEKCSKMGRERQEAKMVSGRFMCASFFHIKISLPRDNPRVSYRVWSHNNEYIPPPQVDLCNLDPSSIAHWKVYAPGPETTGNSRNSREKLFLMSRDFLPPQGVLTAGWGFRCSLSQLSHCPLPTTHQGKAAPPPGTEDLQHVFPGGKCHYRTCRISNALKFCFYPSFFLSLSIPFLFLYPDLDHALKHTKIVRSGHWRQARAGSNPLCMQMCVCTHLEGWPCFKLESKTPTVDDHSSGILERKLGNQRTTFPCFSRKNRVNL